MKKEKKRILPFIPLNKFVLRVPAFSHSFIQFILGELKKGIRPYEIIKSGMEDPYLAEAIFVAAPELYQEWLKLKDTDNSEAAQAVIMSVFKYLTRASVRCTPFGLFSGCGVGNIGDQNEVLLSSRHEFRTRTRLDMAVLGKLSRLMMQDKRIIKDLHYKVNSSLYKIGNEYRYVECIYGEKGTRHILSSIEASEHLDALLLYCEEGKKKDELIMFLMPFSDYDDATAFIDNLIESQLIVNDLLISVTGDLPERQLLKIADQVKDEMFEGLKVATEHLHKLDKVGPGRDLSVYTSIQESIRSMVPDAKNKYMIQSDLNIKAEVCTLKKELIDGVMDAISVLNRLYAGFGNGSIEAFKNAFYDRYETEEIPITEALDIEIGLGYPVGAANGAEDMNSWLEDVVLQGRPQTGESTLTLTKTELYLLQKYEAWEKDKSRFLIIEEDELKAFPDQGRDVPDTITAMIGVCNEREGLIQFAFAGGSSGANLLGRFCHVNEDIYALANEIIEIERKVNPDAIVAEIVHMPQDRICNVLLRPSLREYEIPYLSNTAVKDECIIPITDLMLTVSSNRLILKSKRFNKEVIPKLTTAHNFSSNALPVYSFLSSFHTHYKKSTFVFAWGSFLQSKPHLPRVMYKNVVLCPETWTVVKSTLEPLYGKFSDVEILDWLSKFRNERGIPDQVVVSESDNKLLIDFNTIISVRIFLGELKKRQTAKLEEFLFDSESALVKRDGESFTNEILLFFKKSINE